MLAQSFISATVLFGSFVVAQSPATVDTPTSLTVCQPSLLNFAGSNPPFIITVLPGGQSGAAPLSTFPTQDAPGQLTWVVDQPEGTAVTLAIRDALGALNFAQQVTVRAGSSTSCLTGGGSNSSMSGGAASGSQSGSMSTPASSGTMSSATGSSSGSMSMTSSPSSSGASSGMSERSTSTITNTRPSSSSSATQSSGSSSATSSSASTSAAGMTQIKISSIALALTFVAFFTLA